MYKENGMYEISSEEKVQASANGVSPQLLYQRINVYNWSVERAINEKVGETALNGKSYTEEHLKIAEKNGISRQCFNNRINTYGWSVDDAMTVPPNRQRAGQTPKYTEKEYQQALANGICKSTFSYRLSHLGWTMEDAINTPVRKRNRRK